MQKSGECDPLNFCCLAHESASCETAVNQQNGGIRWATGNTFSLQDQRWRYSPPVEAKKLRLRRKMLRKETVEETSAEAETAENVSTETSEETSAGDPAAITGADLRRHVAILASDEFAGRAPGTEGGDKTREYIAGEYERIGLQKVNGSYFQTVPMVESTLNTEESFLQINGEALEYKVDTVYWTKRVEEDVSFADSDMVFVGYGVVAPEYNWNDYEGVDVVGKTVVILVNDPGFATQDPDLFNGNAMTYYGRWTYKYEEAARQGAAGGAGYS